MSLRTSDEIDNAVHFFDAMVPVIGMAERTAALLRRRLGTEFSMADYSVGGYEPPLNRILADLLSPRGSHGQAAAFLELFLKMLGNQISMGDPQLWSAVPNHSTYGGRLPDIALLGPDVVIYVESKPWAREGAEQLGDYAKDLVDRPETHKWLVFAPGWKDRQPETVKPDVWAALGIIVPFQRDANSTPSIIGWLESCARITEAPNVRTFIEDLARYLDAEFPNKERNVSMHEDPVVEALVPLVSKNREYMKVVLASPRVVEELWRTIPQSFVADLKTKLEKEMPQGWQVIRPDVVFDANEKDLLSLRKDDWPETWSICLQMQNKEFKNFLIGFSCPSEPKEGAPLATPEDRAKIAIAIREVLRSIGGREPIITDPSWPGYSWLPSPFKTWDDDTLLHLSGLETLANGKKAIDLFAEWFKSLAKAVQPLVDDIGRQGRWNTRPQ